MYDALTPYKQIYPSQICKLQHLGYRSLITLRPDNEAEDQPKSKTLAVAAESKGIAYAYLPVDGERLNKDTVAQFATLYHTMPKPIMLTCRSGARAKLLYQSALMAGLL